MKSLTVLITSASVAFASVQSFAQDKNPWGETFACSVNWFVACTTTRVQPVIDSEKPKDKPASTMSDLPLSQQRSNLPEPVRNVLENPSHDTARAYVLWSRQASEKLAKASEYIAQATREISSEVNSNERGTELALAGVGPVGLYYFFSPGDPSAAKDVAVLNKIWSDGRIGIVGIPVRGNDEEVVNFVNEARPLFPIRRSEGEVRLVKPTETPDLYLARPLERKIFRLGPTVTETAITEAIGSILAAQSKGNFRLDSLASGK